MESASLTRTLQRHQTTAWVTFVFIATMTLLGAFLPQERYEFAPRGFFEIGRRNLGGRNRSLNR